MPDSMEHFIEIPAQAVLPWIIRPDEPEDFVRVFSSGFIARRDGAVFAVVDMIEGAAGGEEMFAYFCAVLGEVPSEDEENELYIDVAYLRLRLFLRTPETTTSPVYLHASGILCLNPAVSPFAQFSDWGEEDIWTLEQHAERFNVPVQTISIDELELDFSQEEDESIEFW